MVIADLNADGKNDVALAAEKKLLVYKGTWSQPELQLLSSTTVPNAISVIALAIGTLNAGSSQDAVVRVPRSSGDYAYVYLNNGAGGFSLKSQLLIAKPSGGEVGISDINGDRKMDLFIENQSLDDRRILYALGKGDGTFGAPLLITSGDPSGFALRDLNLDSRHDFAMTDWLDGTYVFRNSNAATNCAPPGSDTVRVRVCFAGRSGSLRDTIGVRAAGNSPAGVKRLELWIDGKKRFQTYDDQMHTRVSGLSSGSHRIVVQVVDLFGTVAKRVQFTTLP